MTSPFPAIQIPSDPTPVAPVYDRPRYNNDVPFTVRDFQPADFETLWRLDQECFPPGISYSQAELKHYMRRSRSFTLVVEDAAVTSGEGLVAGFIVAEADGRGQGHIITIDVIASARRFGLGSLLLGSAEDRLRAAGCRSIELETAVDNSSALAFYKRHGYSVIKTFPRYYSNGVDALVLQKDLA
ncbi:MAG: N-acetyltransferase [Candidatus Sulfotelmatobacter sp.]